MYILFVLFWPVFSVAQSESALRLDCATGDEKACEKLAAHYLDKEQWGKAQEVSEALCKKEVPLGCTILGSSLLAQKKYKEANTYFNRACDKFEPYACRSLGRFYQKVEEEGPANLYFKRACHYGLKEVCKEVKESKQWYSPPALILIENFRKDCRDTQAESCKTILARVDVCEAPLTKQDCLMVAGYISIHLRAKLLQAEALSRLFALHAAEAAYYVSSKPNKYTYDLTPLMKGVKRLDRLNYVFGFMRSCTKKNEKKKRAKNHSQEIWPASYKHHNARYMANVMAYLNTGMADECYPASAGFQAFAVAALDPLNPTRLDVWMIDQDKHIENVQDGLPLP